MFTATGSEEIAVEAMKQGLDDYIIKNVKHLVRLRGAVQSALDHALTRRRADQLASRLESLLSQLKVGVFRCTPDGRFLELNDALLELVKGELPEAVDQQFLQALFVDRSRADHFLHEVVSSDVPREIEIQRTRDPGETMTYRLNARMVETDQEPLCVEGLFEDITHRKRSEANAKHTAVAAAQIEMLSPRERDVLREVVTGAANKVIARRLDISEKTVEKHRANLTKKLHVRSVAELVRLAMLAENRIR